MSYEEILLEAEEKMERAVEVLREELRGVRTGRATPALVDGIRAEYYGTQTPLKQMANISCPDPRMIVVKPYDATQIAEIEKAILKANIGLTPNSDGKLIRLQVPELSRERRTQLANQVKDLAEKAKIAIRNVRRDANKDCEREGKDGLLTDDEAHKLKEDIQELTKRCEGQVGDVETAKKNEIMAT